MPDKQFDYPLEKLNNENGINSPQSSREFIPLRLKGNTNS